jgi:hypothetical protein
MYEVAVGLSRLLLEKPTANDTLLLTTILSTDLGLLKKRGFNVERILKKRAAEQVARVEPSRPLNDNTKEATAHRSLNREQPLSTEIQLPNARESNNRLPTESQKVPDTAPLSRSNIANLGKTIEKAIRACHSESDSRFDVLQSIRENLKQEFYDTCGAINTLRFIGEEARVKVFLAQDISQPNFFLDAKRSILRRFVNIITVLGSLFGLPVTDLHIFFDQSSQHIAFNREGSLFFNLRFYEAWHDQDVEAGNKIDAYAFWYFTFAHEIAHNLVQDHNAEHEFYFSATSQKYIIKLFKLF